MIELEHSIARTVADIGVPPEVGAAPAPQWNDLAAVWVSRVCSPPVVTSLGIWCVAGMFATPAAWMWALGEWALVVVLPALYVVWLVYRGNVADLDVCIREQRIKPYRVTILFSLVMVLLAWLMAAPQVLLLFSVAAGAQVIVLFAVTTRWKISLHSAAMASLCVVAWRLAGPAAFPLVASIPLVSWARVHLRRHTLAQTVAGTLVGALIYSVALMPLL
ncbi:MAG: hypothetical protein M1546_24155 [Chloroflexi bacterium]|nr:hypothetical protein [Chloroflexota bacterium]